MICKVTKKKINPFMSIEKMPIANGFLKKKRFQKRIFFQYGGWIFKRYFLISIK